MEKNSIDSYISHLVNDDKISCEDMLLEVSDIIEELKDVEDANIEPTPIMVGLGMKLLKEVSPEETVPKCIVAMRSTKNNIELTSDMEEELKAYALCGFRKGIEEMKKSPSERMDASDYLLEATSDYTAFLNLPEEIRIVAMRALNDGYLIATLTSDVVQNVMIYIITMGFEPEKVKDFFDFVRSNNDNAE